MAVGGYALLLALRRGPAPAGDPPSLLPHPALPEPTRLPHRPSFVPASAPVFRGAPAAQAPLPVVVQGLPEAFVADAGVAVFETERMSALHWRPLAGLPRQERTIHLDLDAPPDAPLLVTLAGAENTARRGYWCATRVPAGRDPDAPVVLDARVQDLTVRIDAATTGTSQDLQLRRADDPGWQALPVRGQGAAGALQWRLGPGSYRLAPLTGGPWQPVAITVPGPAEVTATFARPPLPGDRP